MKWFLQRILQEMMIKNLILGTSDSWSMSHSSHRPGEPAYYIEDCRIYSPKLNLFIVGAFPRVGVWKKHGFLLLSGSTVSLRVEVWMSLTLQDNDLLALITFLGVDVSQIEFSHRCFPSYFHPAWQFLVWFTLFFNRWLVFSRCWLFFFSFFPYKYKQKMKLHL